MELNLYLDRYRNATHNFYRWRYELELAHKLILALGFACLTGLAAQARLYLPWTPVPVTGQTFAVLLSAIVLGKWGGVSQSMYVGLGVAGMPWFVGMSHGWAYLTGATGGYLIGFVLAAFFLGLCVDRHIRSRSFTALLALMLFANFALIYGPGLLQLYLWLTFVKGSSVSLVELTTMGLTPFIIGDLFKIGAAVEIARSLIPQLPYGEELDGDSWTD